MRVDDGGLAGLVACADRVGMSPTEWLHVCEQGGTVAPPTPEEWREALLSTLEEPV